MKPQNKSPKKNGIDWKGDGGSGANHLTVGGRDLQVIGGLWLVYGLNLSFLSMN